MAVDDLRSGTWVTYVGGRATSARLRRCRVEVVSGPDAGLVRDVEAPVIRIGARRGNDVQLTDSKVSGLHCEIRLDDRDTEQNAIADALIAYLVRWDLAESRSEETEPGHYDYFISVNWDALYQLAESAGIDLPAALARAASIPSG